MKKNYKSKIVLITGAKGFLGKKISNYFAKKKFKLILIDKYPIKISKKIDTYVCDFTNEEDREINFQIIKKKYKSIDLIINNAGYTGSVNDKGWITKFENQDLKNWNKAFEVNLNSIFHLVKILKTNLEKSKGRIINIGSIYSIRSPNPKLYEGLNMNSPAAYSASKGGLLQLTRWLAIQLAPKISVNMISPIGIKRSQPKKFLKRYCSLIPMKQMCSEEDIVKIISFLSIDSPKLITGQNIILDGGSSII